MKFPTIPPLPAGVVVIITIVLGSLGITDTTQVAEIKTTIAVVVGLAVLAYNYEFHKTKRNQVTAASNVRRPIVISPAPSDAPAAAPVGVPVAATVAAGPDTAADSTELTL